MAIYSCGRCHFVFERGDEVSSCPDCGFYNITEADPDDKASYIRYQVEFNPEYQEADQHSTKHT